jgi:hypothetical protein
MSWQAATAVMLQERLGLEKYVTAQMYYSLVGRGLEYEFQSFAEYHNIGILVWSPLAGGFLTGKYTRENPAPAGTRYAEAGSFVPFEKEMGYRVVEALKEVAGRHDTSPARVALSWVLGRPAISSVIIAARKVEQRPTSRCGVGSRDSVPEVDGPSARHRGRPAFEGSVSRALLEWRPLERPPWDPSIGKEGLRFERARI